jgi:hypothetical protein
MTTPPAVDLDAGALESVYRVQDIEGRGPYRPGLSQKWCDPTGPANVPWWLEIGETIGAAHARMADRSMHYGCGFATLEQLHSWFTPRELRTLDRLGFKLVRISPDAIIALTPTQVVFGSRPPLASAAPRISLVSKLARAA